MILHVMDEIRTTKIDWVEFVTYKDYLRLKEEKQELEYLWDINEELKEENKKLEERIKELETTKIICIFVPYWVEPTFSEKDYPYKWEDEDGTYYSIMSKEEYLTYIEWEWY